MTVTAVSAYGRGGASTRVRLLDWLDHLRLDAVVSGYRGGSSNRPKELLCDPVGTLRAERSVRTLPPSPGPLLLSREASPFSRGGVESRLLREAQWGVYDFDDAIYLPGGGIRGRLRTHETCARACGAADVVIVGNETLAAFASDHAVDVRIIPSCVEPATSAVKTSWQTQDQPVIGWLGSPSTEAYVAGLAPSLLEVHRRTGARLRLISGPTANPALAPLEGLLERVPWTPQGYAAQLVACDVGIGPLVDDAWARGKCAYKLLQYGTTGLPMVASPVGANALALTRLGGVPASNTTDWVDALVGILEESEEDRERRGRLGRAGVAEHYSFVAWAAQWADAVGVPQP